MFRCILAEFVSLGGGHALSGGVRRAAAWMAAVVVCVVLALWTPWAVIAMVVVRLASIVEAGRRGRRGPVGGQWHWKPMVLFIVVSFGFLLATRVAVLEAFKTPSASMAPTLVVGDFVITDKLSLRWRAPSRGEVVVYRVGGIDFIGRVVAVGGDEIAVRGGALVIDGKNVPQRPAGMLEYDAGEGWTHERALAFDEELDGHHYRVLWLESPEPQPMFDFPREDRDEGCDVTADAPDPRMVGVDLAPGRSPATCVVPAGTVFILGDNRGNSNDSRHRGAFPVSSVRARVVGIWRPLDRIGAIE